MLIQNVPVFTGDVLNVHTAHTHGSVLDGHTRVGREGGGRRQFCPSYQVTQRFTKSNHCILPIFNFDNKSKTTCSPFLQSFALLDEAVELLRTDSATRWFDLSLTIKTQVLRTIRTSDTLRGVRLEKHLTFHNGFIFLFLQTSHVNKNKQKTFHHESSRTAQHSKCNCVGTNRPQHMHIYGHIVCD